MSYSGEKIRKNKGVAMLTALLFFLSVSLILVSGMISPALSEFKNSGLSLRSKQSYFLAESGSEDATYRIFNNKGLNSTETINLGLNSASTTITSVGNSQKEIESLGQVSGSERQVGLTLTYGDGALFKYGTQAGQGGVVFKNNSYLNGNLYTNGDIVGSNGAYITGDAYVAGGTGSISNMRVGYGGTGNIRAHNVTDSTVTGNLYCQSGSGNNKPCDTSLPDPLPQEMPISNSQIEDWKNDGTAGGITAGDVIISSPTTLGSRQVSGNLTVNSTLTIADTIYVTGNVIINGTVKLSSAYGATSAIIVADGYIIISNGAVLQDSGTPGSYVMFLSESDCDASMAGSPCEEHNAIEVSNNSDISIVNAQRGTIYFSNNATVKEAVGNKIELKNNVGISYGSGIISVDFTSGPSGSWVISSWQETK